MERFLSAPGKLFLSGEYAVLWGGTARVVAVAPRVSAFVRRREDQEVHLVLESGRLVGRMTPMGARWLAPVSDPFFFAARTIDDALRAHGKDTLGFDVALAPSPTSADGQKLGLGGSARTCVLVSEAVRYVLVEKFDALKVALLAHASAQNMRGSGADVAAVFAGGVVRYRRYPVERLAHASATGSLQSVLSSSPPVDVWRLPSPRLVLSYVFTGQSARTERLVQEVERRVGEAERASFVAASDELGNTIEEALLSGEFSVLEQVVPALHQRLCELGPLETPGVQRVLALARAFGAVGKLSGAGGGDGCVLFSPDEERQKAMLEAFAARGLTAMPVTIEAGLRGEAVGNEHLRSWLVR